MPAARVEYIAPWWVVWLHSVPHLGLRLQPVDSTFRPRDESYQEVSPRPGAPSPRTALSRLPARLAPRASRPHTPPTPHSLRSLFPRRPFPRVLGPQPSRLGTSRAWTTGKMGVKPVNGTGGRALPAGRGLGLSAQGEGSAAQGSGLGVHWYLNPVILARQLRGAGAGRRGAPGVSLLLRVTRRALAFRVCATWEKFGQKLTGVCGFVPAAALLPSPFQPLHRGPSWKATDPEERGVDPQPHVDKRGKESAPSPAPPTPPLYRHTF